ncbi:MAG: ABC transporter permease [Candidatus Nanopelagicales bacterium]|nr:ABC transporter permease [Candidatus Nanopelagicales bacterium]MCF8537848.1 ABC transporter permease [Candidatus Nanopelagicales bacterium]MCF8543184.1 ABC transporter permease [Candidatus Nanopelagicales bacterium]MCF8557423.1 ABC transporter permease [Candidatus Nanopelagicales bacterium]
MVAVVPTAARSGASAPVAQRSSKTGYLLLFPGMAWLGVFFAIPFVTLFMTSLQAPVAGSPGKYQFGLEFGNYASAMAEYWPLFLRSFLYAGIATLLALAIAYPLAYFIAFRAGQWRSLMLVLVIAPSFASFLLRTYAWKTILADEGIITSTLNSLHLLPEGRILNTGIAVVAGLTYNFLPFMILPLYAALEKIDPRLMEAAGDLYASPQTAFRKVTWPLSMPGIVAGTLLTFIPASGDYINAALLGSTGNRMIGNAIQINFIQFRDYPTASALSFVLMAAILVLVFTYIRRAGTEDLV